MQEKNYKGRLLIIFSIVLIDLIGFGIVIPLLPIYAESYGARPFIIGLLGISYSVTQLLFNPIWGAFSDRVGRRPILLMSLFGAIIFYTLFGWAPSLLWLFVARAGAGVFAANISTAMAYISDITTRENRTKGMGLIGAAFGLGFIIGPAFGGYLSQYSYSLPGYGAACLSFIAFTLAFFKLPETVKKKEKVVLQKMNPMNFIRPIGESLKNKALISPMLVFFLVTFAFSAMQIIFPLFTMKIFGFDVKENGYLFAFSGFLAILFQGGIIGRLSKRFGEGVLAVFGTFLMAVGMAMLPFATHLSVLLLALAIMSVGMGLSSPSLNSLISLNASEEEQGSVIGVSRSVSTLARILGPLWGGWSFGAFGFQWPFFTSGLVLFVAIFVGWPMLYVKASTIKNETVTVRS